MFRYLISSALGVLLAGALLTGCSASRQAAAPSGNKPTTKVAGTREAMGTATVTITNTQWSVSPSTVPAGNGTLSIKNDSNDTLTFTGAGGQKIALKPGMTMMMPVTKSGSTFKFGVPTMSGTAKTMPTEKSATTTGKGGTATVTVTDTQWSISPATIPAGTLTINIMNKASNAITLAMGKAKPATVQPGKTATMKLTKSGYTYKLGALTVPRSATTTTKPATGTTKPSTTGKPATGTTKPGTAKPSTSGY